MLSVCVYTVKILASQSNNVLSITESDHFIMCRSSITYNGGNVLTPFGAHKHWTSSMPGQLISLAAGKQVVPEGCSAFLGPQ